MQNHPDFTNMNIKERVLYIADRKELNRTYFFKKLGFYSSNFSGVALQKKINQRSIFKVIKTYPDVNLQWLINGSGDPFERCKTDENLKKARIMNDSLKDTLTEIKNIMTSEPYHPFKDLKRVIPEKFQKEYEIKYTGLLRLPHYFFKGHLIKHGIEEIVREFKIEGMLLNAEFIMSRVYQLILNIPTDNKTTNYLNPFMSEQSCIDFLKKTGKYKILKIDYTEL